MGEPPRTSVRAAAPMRCVTLVHTEHTPTNFADAFALITRDRPHALFVARSGAAYANRQLIAAFVAFPDRVVGSACALSFSRFAQRSLALRPAHSRCHRIS